MCTLVSLHKHTTHEYICQIHTHTHTLKPYIVYGCEMINLIRMGLKSNRSFLCFYTHMRITRVDVVKLSNVQKHMQKFTDETQK